MKKRITSLLLLITAVFTIAVQSGVIAYADTTTDTNYSANGKKDIPDIFSLE